MRLTHLSLTDFRNFSRLDANIPAGTILVVGENAQGKTSLLEAVYYLAALVSFHASSDRQVINFLAGREPIAVARVTAEFERFNEHHRLEVRIIQEYNGVNGARYLRKEVLLDNIKLKSSEAVGQFKAVLFLPQMLSVVDGAPEERRRYLNLALSQVQPFYAATLAEYSHALSQRNALLKQLGEQGGDPRQLDYWDGLLAASGAQLVHARIRAVHDLDRLSARYHRELTRSSEVLHLNYLPAFEPLPTTPLQFALPIDSPIDRTALNSEQIRSRFLERLACLRSEEMQRGVTTIGPHRDELRFLSNGIDLGNYGSRGQIRTAMLALKLAEVDWIVENTGHHPVLLFDEVLAELDEHRRQDLLNRLTGVDQALLTTTDLDLFAPDFIQRATLWQIQEGRLLQKTGN